MSSNYIGPGGTINFTASGNVASGQVLVIGSILAVSLSKLSSGQTGAAKTSGVFVVPKVSGAVIGKGETLTWDVSAGAFDDNLATPAVGDVTGESAVAWEAAGNGVTSMQVLFTGTPGTVKT